MAKSGKVHVKQGLTSALDSTEDFLYGVLALLLIIAAILALWAAIQSISTALSHGDIVAGVIEIIDRVLLVLMIAEILYTVALSFKSHALLPGPFLVVALIAAVRRVLLISLEAAHPSTIESTKFHNYMIELGVLGLLIAIFVISLRVLGKKADTPIGNQAAFLGSGSKEE
jgi:uncharacterized membrane protein (DUF373 family)